MLPMITAPSDVDVRLSGNTRSPGITISAGGAAAWLAAAAPIASVRHSEEIRAGRVNFILRVLEWEQGGEVFVFVARHATVHVRTNHLAAGALPLRRAEPVAEPRRSRSVDGRERHPAVG